jgi:hypothetical protein
MINIIIIIFICLLPFICNKLYNSYLIYQINIKRKRANQKEFDKLFQRAMSSPNPGKVFESHPNYGKWGTYPYDLFKK